MEKRTRWRRRVEHCRLCRCVWRGGGRGERIGAVEAAATLRLLLAVKRGGDPSRRRLLRPRGCSCCSVATRSSLRIFAGEARHGGSGGAVERRGVKRRRSAEVLARRRDRLNSAARSGAARCVAARSALRSSRLSEEQGRVLRRRVAPRLAARGVALQLVRYGARRNASGACVARHRCRGAHAAGFAAAAQGHQ